MSERQKMRWYAGRGQFFSSQRGRYSLRLENGTSIEIDPDIYDQRFDAYLARLGVKRTSWSEIIGKAEREWQAYYQLMGAFAENTQQWFTDRDPGVFIDPPPGQELSSARTGYDTHLLLQKEREKLSVARREMIWHAGRSRHSSSEGGYLSIYLEDGTRIEVSSETYAQRFNAYLNHLGVKPTTWSQIMGKAEAEWQAYCQLMDAFAENIQQWLDDSGNGIFVEQPQEAILFK